jgi:hypothetical protein
MRIKVGYSLDLDVWNYLRSVYRFVWYKHGRNNLQEKLFLALPDKSRESLKRAKSEREAKEVIERFLSQGLDGRKFKYAKIAQDLEENWVKDGPKVEKKLEKIYARKIPFKTLKIYLSSLPICPYNFKKRWIMVFADTRVKRQIEILAHELNHFMFYYYFGYLKKELGEEKFESLKEALTVFTNPEEKGYPNQERLRVWLSGQKKTIPEIIESGRWRQYI